ncbi:MAG: nucleotidyltransferase family protein [Proteobacteria bacterium]|nr:MAG: nucleotidyltransferase family protein [Pseudomonadota bacterium]
MAAAQITGILLAAGAGSRFGGRKLLHRLADGTALGVASLRNLRTALPHIVAVVRAGDTELADLLSAEGVTVVECANAHLGMGHTLAAGVLSTSEAHGWIVALGDMPCIASKTIGAIKNELANGAPIVVPVWHGRRGHPVGFSHQFRDELMRLQGDVGARSILASHSTQVRLLEVNDEGVVKDVDTLADVPRTGGTAKA